MHVPDLRYLKEVMCYTAERKRGYFCDFCTFSFSGKLRIGGFEKV